MITKTIKITIAHEISTTGDYTLEEIDAKVRKLLKETTTSDERFWKLGKDFCYDDSYPVEIQYTASFNI